MRHEWRCHIYLQYLLQYTCNTCWQFIKKDDHIIDGYRPESCYHTDLVVSKSWLALIGSWFYKLYMQTHEVKCGYICIYPSHVTIKTLQMWAISSPHHGSQTVKTWKFPQPTMITGTFKFRILPYGHCSRKWIRSSLPDWHRH